MNRPVRVGFDVPFEPFGLIDAGRATGMLVDLVRALLDRAHVAHEFVAMTLAETEGALFGGTVDALAFKGVTPERRHTMRFSAPLVVSGGATFTRIDDAPATTLAACAGRRVVTPRKGPLWSHIERNHPGIVLVDGESYEGSFDALANDRADVAALNLHAGIAIAQRLHPGRFRLPAEPYMPLEIGFAIAADGPADLLAAVDRALVAARADGTWQRIHDQWTGRPPAAA